MYICRCVCVLCECILYWGECVLEVGFVGCLSFCVWVYMELGGKFSVF